MERSGAGHSFRKMIAYLKDNGPEDKSIDLLSY